MALSNLLSNLHSSFLGDREPNLDDRELSRAMPHEHLEGFLADGEVEPVHPGILYRDLVIRARKLKIGRVAEAVGISREMLHRILRGDAAITPNTAIGLGKVAGNGPEFWLRSQQIYDLWQLREHQRNMDITPPLPAAAAL
jgi:addiction module HigA family antidote